MGAGMVAHHAVPGPRRTGLLASAPMTVAAVILSASAGSAVADTEGQPRVRRLVDIAWAGGALPVIVVSPDPDGAVARALLGSEASHGLPAAAESGPVGQMLRGAELAQASVHDLDAILIWPARLTWVGAETVTSLIEAHGVARGEVLIPTWQSRAGWPVLVPLTLLPELAALAPDRMPSDLMTDLVGRVPSREIDLGDPGVVFDVDTARADLPTYEGPPAPPAGHTHEWGDDVIDEADLPEPAG